MTIRERVRIKPGGTIELSHPELPPGEEAEVTIVVQPADTAQATGLRPLWEEADEIAASVPEEEWERVPADLSKNLRHYLYGAPREED